MTKELGENASPNDSVERTCECGPDAVADHGPDDGSKSLPAAGSKGELPVPVASIDDV